MKKLTEEIAFNSLHQASEDKKAFICCDYDGTLVSFDDKPQDTATPNRVTSILKELNSLASISIAILSGRSLAQLKDLIPLSNITLAGLHGIEVRYSDGEKFTWSRAEESRGRLKKMKKELADKFSAFPGTLIEDKEYAVALHYRTYKGKDEEVERAFYSTMENFRPFENLEILEGSKLLEVRPRGWDKGRALKKIRSYLTFRELPTFYFGDDTTDEDAFRVLNREGKDFPVLIGENGREETAAHFFLSNPEELLSFLERLAENI